MTWLRDLGRRRTAAGVLAAGAVVAALALAVAPGARTSRRTDESVVVNADPVADTISDCPTTVQDASAGGRSGSEQSLAVDPANRNYVLLGSIEDDLYSHPVVSHDCGQTWSFPQSAVGFQPCTGDQSVGWDRHGNAIFVCDTTEDFYSSDGGATWQGPVVVVSPADNMGDAIDRPWVVVDNSGGPRDGTDYIVWESFFTNPLGWVLERSSTDHGATWGPVHRVDDPASAQPTQSNPRNFPVIGADGTLYVAYDQGLNVFGASQENPITIVIARSTDGGVTYSRSAAATDVVRNSSPDDASELITSLAADPSPSRANQLALVWADNRTGESRTLFEDSLDGGKTWTKPVDINDDPPGHGNEHDHAQVVFLPDGRALVVWRDRRCCGGGYADDFEIWARPVTIAPDGSVTLGTTVPITTGKQAPGSKQTNEYIAVTAGPEGVSFAWPQVVNGTHQSVYRRVPLSWFAAADTAEPPVQPTPVQAIPLVKPKGIACRRRARLALPRLGEHPDVDGDKDDRYKVIDAAVLIGANSRRIFPTHGHLPKRIRVTVSGSGKQTVTVKLVTYVSKGHAKSTHRALTRTYRIPPCGGSVQSSGTTMSGHRPD